MSYSHEEFVIDLTQVTQSTGPNNVRLDLLVALHYQLIRNSSLQSQVMHELEIEFARPSLLLSTAAARGDPSVSPTERDAFDELVRAFVNNVRVLVRNTRPA